MAGVENDNYISPGRRLLRSGVSNGYGQGLSVRDHFASCALQGLLAGGKDEDWLVSSVVGSAYQYADEMLKQRENKEN